MGFSPIKKILSGKRERIYIYYSINEQLLRPRPGSHRRNWFCRPVHIYSATGSFFKTRLLSHFQPQKAIFLQKKRTEHYFVANTTTVSVPDVLTSTSFDFVLEDDEYERNATHKTDSNTCYDKYSRNRQKYFLDYST